MTSLVRISILLAILFEVFIQIGYFLWTSAQRSLSEVHYIFPMFYFYFLWPPYSSALVNEVRESFTRGEP